MNVSAFSSLYGIRLFLLPRPQLRQAGIAVAREPHEECALK